MPGLRVTAGDKVLRRVAGISLVVAFSLGVLAAAGLVAQSATIVLGIPAQRVESHLTLSGGVSSGDLPTHLVSATVTDTLSASASPGVVSTFATGEVVFTYYSQCTRECGGISVRVPPGSDLSTKAGVHYVTLTDEWFRTTSNPVPVRAVLPGASGNTGPGTVVNFGYNEAPGLVVTNPRPISGGADRQTHIVSQADYDTLERAVAAEAIANATTLIRVRTKGMGYAFAELPTLTEESSDSVGDETQTFTITITATLDAYAFFDNVVRARLGSAIQEQVGPGRQVTRDSMEVDYKIVKLSPAGDVTVTATGVRFVIPEIPTRPLQSRLAGLSLEQARDVLKRSVPDARVRIEVWPYGVSWLPVVPDNIRVAIARLPALPTP